MSEEKERTEDLRVLRLIHTGVRRKEKEGVHPFHELYYISEGSCSVFIGHRVYALLPKGTALSDYDVAQLKRSGIMIRG